MGLIGKLRYIMEVVDQYPPNGILPKTGKLIKFNGTWHVLEKVIDSCDNRVEIYDLETPMTRESLRAFGELRSQGAGVTDYDYIGMPVTFRPIFIDSKRHAHVQKFLRPE
jgi:hypothetical protein